MIFWSDLFLYEKMNFESKIIKFIGEHQLFEPGDRVLLAVSGGADSTALLYLMADLKDELSIDIFCSHINHQLRPGDAEKDLEFVNSICTKLGIKFISKTVCVRDYAKKNKLSIETAARELRIAGLREIAKKLGCSKIATAHHKDDNAETMIQRLARGTGFRGLGGIWPKKRIGDIDFVRPMLKAGRSEIENYLKVNRRKWRHDYTNDQIAYRRNFIRHKLLPALQRTCGDLVNKLSRLSAVSQSLNRKVNDQADKVSQKIISVKDNSAIFDIKSFLKESPLVKVELIRRGLEIIGCGEQPLTSLHYQKMLKTAENKDSGKKIELPNKYFAVKENKKLILARKISTDNYSHEKTEIKFCTKVKFQDITVESQVLKADEFNLENYKKTKSPNEEAFDFDKLEFPLWLRLRRTGDKFKPFGSSSVKKVGKFLTSQKVTASIRKKLMVVCDSENIIWLWPVRTGDKAKINGKTKEIIKISIAEGGKKQNLLKKKGFALKTGCMSCL